MFSKWPLAVALAIRSLHAADHEPLFAAVPFEKWLAEDSPSPFHWSLRIPPAFLDRTQRMRTRIEVQIDGEDLVKRKGHGQLVILVEAKDSRGQTFRTAKPLDLDTLEDSTQKLNFIYAQDVFLMPGDYQFAVAAYDAMTREHGVLDRAYRVNALKNDPLPNSWTNLPPVEFLREKPLTGRLHLPLETPNPARIEVLVNISRTAGNNNFRRAPAQGRSALEEVIPALSILSQIEMKNGTMNISLLDLARRKVVYEEDARHGLDWPKLDAALDDANPLTIDAKSLSDRGKGAQFFLKEVNRRLAPGTTVVVLSGNMAFESGEDLRAIEADSQNDGKVFYIRYHTPPPIQPVETIDTSRRNRRAMPSSVTPLALYPDPDSLAATLKPIHPKLFDVTSPEQFRKALATLLNQLAADEHR